MSLSSILVPVSGTPTDKHLVELACQLLHSSSSRLFILYIMEIKRSLPIDAALPGDVIHGDNVLKSMEKRGLIERKPNPLDGRGVIIHLTEFGREKRQYSKEKVLKFNEDIRNHVSEEKLKHFYEVADLINERVSNKKIYNQNEIKSS